ncbi:glycosyltransferase [Hazenella sp. IB182357]|uniref:Glycosyltransferase n=1 Tax=Polycladospora coralii TaxID=2771432 RepID=A0A926NHP5_9BACL|nr:glycosyltransferase [Polycladospora coralii]MBD1373518.1 glycosyltransferase [Polycladospora coralii]MBS7531886.1 glycosyltransferase [Polycladospora coralii]
METFDIRVLFVRSDLTDPYIELENAMISHLQDLVNKVEVTSNKLLIHHCLKFQPQLIIIFAGFLVENIAIQYLKRLGYSIAIWIVDDPYHIDVTKNKALLCDIIFTQDSGCVRHYQACGHPHVYHLPLGVDIHTYYADEIPEAEKIDFCFLGSGFTDRISFFNRVFDYLSSKRTLISGRWWERLAQYDTEKGRAMCKLTRYDASETANIYRHTKIAINLHRHPFADPHNDNQNQLPAQSINNRIFEVLSCGTFLLTNCSLDLTDYYNPDTEIGIFNSSEEFIQKAAYYLKHQQVRKQMVQSAQQRTHQEHSYHRRLTQLLQTAVDAVKLPNMKYNKNVDR